MWVMHSRAEPPEQNKYGIVKKYYRGRVEA